MGMHTPADHLITTTKLFIEDLEPSALLTHADAEIAKLMKAAKADGRIVISHTVTYIKELKTILFTLHTTKPGN